MYVIFCHSHFDVPDFIGHLSRCLCSSSIILPLIYFKFNTLLSCNCRNGNNNLIVSIMLEKIFPHNPMSAFSLVCGTEIICEMLLIFSHPPRRNRESFLCQRTQISGEWCDTIFAILISVYLVFNSLCLKLDRHYYQTPIFIWDSTTRLREDFIY